MIKVNTEAFPWHPGMTVRNLLDEKLFTFRHIIVRVNGEYVPEEDYETQRIQDEDDVFVLHLMAGG
ncbi:MAG: sulfur carrier protein ThiS [Anaerolineaceae bacterium]|nr:sulfur carrier protein ThiS [Anaerolineaceae bacterium]